MIHILMISKNIQVLDIKEDLLEGFAMQVLPQFLLMLDYLFNETVPGVWDKDQKVVYVKVTVKKWTITTVYPDFH